MRSTDPQTFLSSCFNEKLFIFDYYYLKYVTQLFAKLNNKIKLPWNENNTNNYVQIDISYSFIFQMIF